MAVGLAGDDWVNLNRYKKKCLDCDKEFYSWAATEDHRQKGHKVIRMKERENDQHFMTKDGRLIKVQMMPRVKKK